MNIIDELKVSGLTYKQFQLSENPFKIEPLFRDFRNKELCQKQEPLFVVFICTRH